MPLYDEMLAHLLARGWGVVAASTLAGGAARAAAVLATAPLELARTRAQGPVPGLRPMPAAATAGALGAARAAWTGAAATLARDVPFSALYWGLLEPARGAALAGVGAWRARGGPGGDAAAVGVCNFAAGAAAGAAAAAATTPLDVVKTKVQLEACGGRGGTPGIVATLQSIARARGARALFAGVGPRSARAAPACAIVVSSYELLKMSAAGAWGTAAVEAEVTAAVDS